MVIENLQIAPLGDWLLGTGWQGGWLWSRWGVAVLLAVVLGLGFLAVAALRRRSGRPGPVLSTWTGAILGLFSLVVLAALVMCSTNVTRSLMHDYVAGPAFTRLVPVLGTNWTDGSLYTWLGVIVGLFFGVIYFCCWLAATLLSGPALGTMQCGRAVLEIFTDIARISPRRVFALAWLAARESIRRRVVVVFVVFVLVILFAALFMKKDSLHPAQLYITIVMNCTIFLTMLFALVLSALSLPADIRDRTLHTVVTKPVRKIEIVLGRVLGFTVVGTLLLAGIGAISYGFTVRSLRHSHVLTRDMLHLETLPGNGGYLWTGSTGEAHGHSHHVTIKVPKVTGDAKADLDAALVHPEELKYTVDAERDHSHELAIERKGDDVVFSLGPPQGELQARVPIYGKLSFTDKTGAPKDRGINVGDEWSYRSFIQGRSDARATWTFDGLRAEQFPEAQFPNGIPVEMTIEVFRTHKGNMEKGVPGTIRLGNPATGKRVLLYNFSAKKFATDTQMIPLHFSRPGRDGRIEQFDLFRDLVSDDGRLEISLQCLEYGQSYGMAQPDLYIRAADGSFEWNFVKAYAGIWLQMVLVLSLGVMFSTFVSGPVALLTTIFAVIAGLFSSYIVDLGGGNMIGGGPFEAAQRIMTQDNMISQMEPGFKTSTIKAMDEATAVVMRYLSAVLPEFNESSFGRHLAYGFDVGADLLGRCALRELCYVLPVLLLGFLCLKQKEMAQ